MSKCMVTLCRDAGQVGCGADELIDLLMRCVLDPGDAIVDCPPTFTMYVFDAAVNDARVVTVPRLDRFKLDVEGELRNFNFMVWARRQSLEMHLLTQALAAIPAYQL